MNRRILPVLLAAGLAACSSSSGSSGSSGSTGTPSSSTTSSSTTSSSTTSSSSSGSGSGSTGASGSSSGSTGASGSGSTSAGSGSTGASSSGSGSTGTSACNNLPLTGSSVDRAMVAAHHPAYAGGNLPAGVFDLIAETAYTGPGGAATADGGARAQSIELGGGILLQTQPGDDGGAQPSTATITQCESVVVATPTCPAGGQNGGTVEFSVFTDGGGFQVYDGDHEENYALRSAGSGTAVADGGAACAALCTGLADLGTAVSATALAAPLPQATGGTPPADGVYALTALTEYTGIGGSTTTTDFRRETVRITGTTIEVVSSSSEDLGVRISGTLAFTGVNNSGVSLTPTCFSTGTSPGTLALGYTSVSATSYTLNVPAAESESGMDEQQTFTLQ